MKFADYVPAGELAFFAEVALALFALAFIAIAVELFTMKGRDELERRRHLPMDDDDPHATTKAVAEETR